MFTEASSGGTATARVAPGVRKGSTEASYPADGF